MQSIMKKWDQATSNQKLGLVVGGLISLAVLLSVLIVGVLIIQDSNISARDAVVTNVTDTGITVTWVSDSPYVGRIVYQEGKDKAWPALFAQNGKEVGYDDRDVEINQDGNYVTVEKGAVARYTHHVTLRDLKPETDYTIRVAGAINGKDMEIKNVRTKAIIEDIQTPDPGYGEIDGIVSVDSIIFLKASAQDDASPMMISAPVSTTGTYSVDMNQFGQEDVEATDFIAYVKSQNTDTIEYQFKSEGYKPFETIVNGEDVEISEESSASVLGENQSLVKQANASAAVGPDNCAWYSTSNHLVVNTSSGLRNGPFTGVCCLNMVFDLPAIGISPALSNGWDRVQAVSSFNPLTIEACCGDASADKATCQANVRSNLADTCPLEGAPCKDSSGVEGVVATGSGSDFCFCQTSTSTPSRYECPSLALNKGDACTTASGNAGTVDSSCVCQPSTSAGYDCPSISKDYGESCTTSGGDAGIIDTKCNCVASGSASGGAGTSGGTGGGGSTSGDRCNDLCPNADSCSEVDGVFVNCECNDFGRTQTLNKYVYENSPNFGDAPVGVVQSNSMYTDDFVTECEAIKAADPDLEIPEGCLEAYDPSSGEPPNVNKIYYIPGSSLYEECEPIGTAAAIAAYNRSGKRIYKCSEDPADDAVLDEGKVIDERGDIVPGAPVPVSFCRKNGVRPRDLSGGAIDPDKLCSNIATDLNKPLIPYAVSFNNPTYAFKSMFSVGNDNPINNGSGRECYSDDGTHIFIICEGAGLVREYDSSIFPPDDPANVGKLGCTDAWAVSGNETYTVYVSPSLIHVQPAGHKKCVKKSFNAEELGASLGVVTHPSGRRTPYTIISTGYPAMVALGTELEVDDIVYPTAEACCTSSPVKDDSSPDNVCNDNLVISKFDSTLSSTQSKTGKGKCMLDSPAPGSNAFSRCNLYSPGECYDAGSQIYYIEKSNSGGDVLRECCEANQNWFKGSLRRDRIENCVAEGTSTLNLEGFGKKVSAESPSSREAVLGASDQNVLEVEESGRYALFDNGERVGDREIIVEGDKVRISLFEDLNGNGFKDEDEEYIEDVTTFELAKEATLKDYQINAGWNAIHVPMVDTRVEEQVSDVEGLWDLWTEQGLNLRHIARYRDGKFDIYSKKQVGGSYSEPFDLIPGEGLFVLTQSSGKVSFSGREVVSSVGLELSGGWNLVGIVSPETDYNSETLLDAITDQGFGADTVSQFENGLYQSVIKEDDTLFGNNFNVIPTRGYFIKVNEVPQGDNTFTP